MDYSLAEIVTQLENSDISLEVLDILQNIVDNHGMHLTSHERDDVRRLIKDVNDTLQKEKDELRFKLKELDKSISALTIYERASNI
jgi:hypothetical protein